MMNLLNDLRHGLRALLKDRAFTSVAVITLALGIGANTAIFSVVEAVLLVPLPYPESDRLVVASLSLPDYEGFRESSRSFDASAVWASNLYNLEDGAELEQVLGAIVSPEFFRLLGRAALGRVFQPEEDGEPLVVLSHELWQHRFGADPGVLGRSLVLSGQSHTIVGVMSPDFQYPDPRFKLWVTFGSAMASAPAQAANRSLRIFRYLGRLKPGVDLETAQAEADTIFQRLQQDYPDTNEGVEIRLTPLPERILGDVRRPLLILMATAGFVLLIACANVANLMLARFTSREREIAIRAALGAGRWQVARQLLTESLLLGAMGGVPGVLLAMWSVDALRGLSPFEIPRLGGAGVDPAVLLFALVLCVVSGVLFGLAPALQAAGAHPGDALKEAGRGASGGLRGRRFRGGLVVAEVTLSLMLLIGAGLLARSFGRLLSVDAGFVTENLLTMNVQLMGIKEPAERVEAARRVVEEIGRLPGVVAAGGGTSLPPVAPQRVTGFEAQGVEIPDPSLRRGYFVAISPDYFRALGTPLFEGRAFGDRDVKESRRVVIINRSLARRLFPGGSAVGRRLKLVYPEESDEWRDIVGVVGDVRYSGLDEPGESAVYTPFAQTPMLWSYIVVRTGGDPAALIEPARKAVNSVDPRLQAAAVMPMRRIVSQSVAARWFNLVLLGLFAGLALVLAAVGIYGVIACSVTQRTHEIGIRMALGARGSDVLRMVARQGLVLTLAGVALGVAGALALTRVLEGLLYEVSTTDPPTFLGTAALLIAVALAASLIPARRASRVDPNTALRHE